MSDPNPDCIYVSIIEDDASLREGLEWMVSSSPGFACAGTYGSCEAAFAAWAETPPGEGELVVMDITLPGMSGIEGMRHIRAHWPYLQALMLTMHEDPDTIMEAIRAGAAGYLTKTTPPDEVLKAIRVVHSGGSSLSGPVARFVLQELQLQQTDPGQHFNLTPRELEILHGLLDGLTYKALGQRHGISIDTVRSHIKKLYQKMQVRSRNEAVTVALRHGLRPQS